MARGGKRSGVGRKRGTPSKHTVAREAAVREAAKKIEAAIPEAFQGDDHALLISDYNTR